MLKIYIGPNGFGKTTALNNEKAKLTSSGIPENEILFLESEILLLDEVKDTKDNSKTMEYIIQELLMASSSYQTAKDSFESEVDNIINANINKMNKIIEDVLKWNNSVRDSTKNFISTGKKDYKKLVTINAKDIKEKMGSGQRMNFILKLVKESNSKKYIFLDEPEKYSHPSMLNETANLIKSIEKRGVNLYIATHSPKLLSMLDIDFENLYIINDSTHDLKILDFQKAIDSLHFKTLGSFGKKEKTYYDITSLINNIKTIHYRQFLEAIFSKKIYICEGINDSLFLNKVLQDNDKYYDDYSIFMSWGKYQMPVFSNLFKQINIEVHVLFDKDNELDTKCKEVNNFLNSTPHHYMFDKDLEDELEYTDSKTDTPCFLSFLDSLSSFNDNYIK